MSRREREWKTRDQERLWAMWKVLRQIAATIREVRDPRADKAWSLALNAMEEDNRRYRESSLADADAAIEQATSQEATRVIPCPCGYWVGEDMEDDPSKATPMAIYDPSTGALGCVECGAELVAQEVTT